MIMILVSSEKPSLTRWIAPAVLAHYSKIYPGEPIVFINSIYFGNAPYHYPHNLKWAQYPVTLPDKYRLAPWYRWHAKMINPHYAEDKKIVIDIDKDDLPEDFLLDYEFKTEDFKKAKEFLFAADPSGFPSRLHHDMIERYIDPIPENERPMLTAIGLYALDNESVIKAFTEKELFYQKMAKQLNAGKVFHYFTYNYNVNSLAIFSPALEKLGIKNIMMSKNMLLLLYWMRENPFPTSEGKLIAHGMCNWKGTGKYVLNKRFQIGGSASRGQIIENLINMGLIDQFKKTGYKSDKSENQLVTYHQLHLGSKGYEFLKLLHKDCNDADLPFRLEQWKNEDFETVKPKIDRYLKTFFGKQKRKMQTW
jgi:hypothetical protein